MKQIQKHLRLLQKVPRHKHHHLIHLLHRKHGISKRTLFYVKEYGPHSNVARTIIRESIKILLLASIISSMGGLALEKIKVIFVSIVPLVILFPALNDMIGDYGAIVSSRFSTLIHEHKVHQDWWKNLLVRNLFFQIITVAMITAAASSLIALIISSWSKYALTYSLAWRIFLVSVLNSVLLVSLIFFTSVIVGLYLYKKKEDPNNFLIPITTSLADFLNIISLAFLVKVFF